MTQPAVNIQIQSDGLLPRGTSAYPIDGTRPSVGAFTIWGTVANGNRISLRSNAGIFGDTGAVVAFRTVLRGSTIGQDYPVTDFIGNASVAYDDAYRLKVVEAPDLAYGKAIVFGAVESNATLPNSTHHGKLAINYAAPASKTFYHCINQFPTANQVNALAILDGYSLWQFKECWEMDSNSGSSDVTKVDWYPSPEGSFWYTSTDNLTYYWPEGCGFSTNDNAGNPTNYSAGSRLYEVTNTAPEKINSRIAPSGLSQTGNPVITQIYSKLDTSNGYFKRIDVEQGVKQLYFIDRAGGNRSVNNGLGVTVDRLKMPGYIRGYNEPDGANWLYQDIYKAVGEGAPARIEMTDNATFYSSLKKTIFTTEYHAASGNQVDVICEFGCMWNETITGKYLHAIDKTDTRTGGSAAL